MKKKTYIFITVIQAVFMMLFLMYAFVQKAEADKQWMVAERNEQTAVEIEKRYLEKIIACETKIDSLSQQK